MAFVIPTIYTAVDKVSAVAGRIASANENMATGMQISGAKAERVWNKLPSVFSGTSKELASMAADFALVAAAIGGASFSFKAIKDYEDAVASFKTIVSDLSSAEFEEYKKQIVSVADTTKKSTIDIAQAFEKIAGLNAEFAATATGLGQAAQASITLAKASRMELAPAAENMVSIMNQFSFSVDQADRTINALAAGQAVGAASISQTALALSNLGATAAGANVSLEQSIGLIQTMAKYGQLGEAAGHRLRSALIKVQEAGVGYTSGKFNLDEALVSLKKQYDAIGTAAAKDAFLTKTFGIEQITAGRILLSNIDLYKQFTQQVTGTTEAYKAAEINSNTLSNRIEELKGKWITLITTSGSVSAGIGMITRGIRFLTDHMSGILTIAVPIIGFFIAWRGYILATTISVKGLAVAQIALNFIQGVGTVINKQYATACFATTAGMNGMAFASFFLERSLLSLSLITGGVIIAIALLANEFTNGYDSNIQYVESLKKTKDGIYELSKPLSEGEIRLQQYNKAMEEFHKLQNYEAFYKRASTFQQIIEPISSPLMYAKYNAATMHQMIPLTAPALSDFDLDQSGKYTPNKGTTNTQVIHHKVDIMQNGNVIGSFDTSASMPSIGSTTN